MPSRSRTRYPHAFSPGRTAPGIVNEGSWDPRWRGLIYNAVAWFTHPVDGRWRLSTLDLRDTSVSGETPEAAARKWLWRLAPEQRAATDRVILWGASRPAMPHFHYRGPVLVFALRGGRLSLVEARDDGTSSPASGSSPHRAPGAGAQSRDGGRDGQRS